MSNYFQQDNATTVGATYATLPTTTIPFQPLSITVTNPLSSGSGAVLAFSFDGVNDHGYLERGETIQFNPMNRTQVWVRQKTAPGAGSTLANIFAWTQ